MIPDPSIATAIRQGTPQDAEALKPFWKQLKASHAKIKAVAMKDDLRRVWEQPTKAAAKRILTTWLRRAENSGIQILMSLARTFGGYRNQILNYYDYPISTGPLEGTNTKIKYAKSG